MQVVIPIPGFQAEKRKFLIALHSTRGGGGGGGVGVVKKKTNLIFEQFIVLKADFCC